MKKQFKIISIFLTAFVFVVLFASCGESHTHSFELKNNATAHWHECSCGEIQDKQEHKFADWMIKKPATEEEAGSKIKVCSGCGYEMTEEIPKKAHTHTYAKTYSSDETGHWYAATCEHTNEKKGFSDHHYGEWITTKPATETEAGSKKKVCSVCGYEHIEEVKMDLEYTLSEDKKSYIVTGIGNVTSKDIVIKDTYNSLPVTSIGNHAFFNCSSLTSITIPNSVTSIGKTAFNNCSSLASVVLPDSLKYIGASAFAGCSSLTSITIPKSVEKIGHSAFGSCGSLTSITIPFVGLSLDGTEDSTFCSIFTFNDAYPRPPKSLKEVFVTGGENIESQAFKDCEYLEKIVLPNSVTSIGSYGFSGCSSLTSIVIPTSVTNIGFGAFFGCISLPSITIPFVGASETENTYFGYIFGAPKNNDIRGYAHSLKEVIITGGTSIGDEAFYSCSNLASITIPNSVTSIGDEAFYSCSNLTSITIPNSVTSVGNYALRYCSSLTSIVIPKSVTSIGDAAFDGCQSLSNVYYEGNIEDWCKLNYGIFYYSNYPSTLNSNHFYLRNSNNEWEEVTRVEIPNTITEIGDYLFDGFNNVTSIIIPENVTSIGDAAFSNCCRLVEIYNLSSLNITISSSGYGYLGYHAKVIHTSLKESNLRIKDDYVFYKDNENAYSLIGYNGTEIDLVLPNGIDGHTYEINDNAFAYCSNLTSITIPNSITSIGEYAFYKCSSLTNMVIPNSVTSLGKETFYNCSSLTSIVIPNSVTSIGKDAFNGCSSLSNVYYEGTIEDWCNSPFNGNTFFSSSNSNHFYLRDSNNEWEEVTSIEIPNTITEIEARQFYRFNNIISITIPESVTSIGYEAFYICSSLTSITIPDSVTSIGWRTFYNCSSLRSITIPDSMTSIGSNAFSGCSNLVYNEYDNGYYLGNTDNPYFILVKAKSTDITSCDINSSNKIICDDAFSECNSLTSVTIPNSVTSIANFTFQYCSNLSNVYYKGSSTEWGNVTIGDNNSKLTLGIIYYYSEIEPTEAGNYWHYVDGVITKW